MEMESNQDYFVIEQGLLTEAVREIDDIHIGEVGIICLALSGVVSARIDVQDIVQC